MSDSDALRPPVLWRRTDVPGLESSRMTGVRDGWKVHGVAVFQFEGQACQLAYDIRCSPAWMTTEAAIEGWIGERDVALMIRRAPDGEWILNAEPQPAVSGCDDIDLHFSPSTNLLPIRRLDLSGGARAVVRAAWLRFPELVLQPLDQTYTRLAPRAYRYAAGSFIADLLVDDEGQVLDYAEWSRVR